MDDTIKFEEKHWEILLPRIKAGTCTPFLGAAVNSGVLPLGGEIARQWAEDEGYPLESRSDLAKVAQYLAIKYDQTWPKENILKLLDKSLKPFDFNDEAEPLNVLAKLPFPIYITTNYDELLFRAIEHHGLRSSRKPVFDICKWNRSLSVQPLVFKRGSRFVPSAQSPVIYHLHGHRSVVDSLVLTEDDYLDFLVNMSRDINGFLPPRIQEAIAGSSVLFIGYSLSDIDFRVLFRGLLGNLEAALGRMSVAVQLPYDDANPNKRKAEEYITRYFNNIKPASVRVYWGTAREFAQDLWKHWKSFNG
jgi:hypothetical protein